jgi:hypothetical protein
MDRLILALLALVLAAWPAKAQTSCGTLSGCPTASTPLSGTELLYVLQNGVSKKVTLSNSIGGSASILPLTNVWTGTNTFTAPTIFTAPTSFTAPTIFTAPTSFTAPTIFTANVTSNATGNWYAPTALIVRLNDRVQIGGATQLDALASPSSWDWVSVLQNGFLMSDNVHYETGAAQFYELAVETQPNSAAATGAGAVFGAAQSLYSAASGTSTIGVFGFAYNNNTTYATSAWALYGECHNTTTPSLGCFGAELETRTTVPTINPTPYGQANMAGAQIGCGAGLTAAGQYDCGAAIQIVANPVKWHVGINFLNGSLTDGVAIALPISYRFQWFTAAGNQMGALSADGTVVAAKTNISFNDYGLQIAGGNGTANYTLAIFFALTSGTPVNYVSFTPAISGNSPIITASGTDTNVDLGLSTTGTGTLRINGIAGVTCSGAPTGAFSSYRGIVTHC